MAGERRKTFDAMKGSVEQRKRERDGKGSAEHVLSTVQWKEKSDGERFEIRRRGADVCMERRES